MKTATANDLPATVAATGTLPSFAEAISLPGYWACDEEYDGLHVGQLSGVHAAGILHAAVCDPYGSAIAVYARNADRDKWTTQEWSMVDLESLRQACRLLRGLPAGANCLYS